MRKDNSNEKGYNYKVNEGKRGVDCVAVAVADLVVVVVVVRVSSIIPAPVKTTSKSGGGRMLQHAPDISKRQHAGSLCLFLLGVQGGHPLSRSLLETNSRHR